MPASLTLTPELAKQIANAVAEGVPLETAAAAARISTSEIHEWLAAAERGTWHNGSPVRATSHRILSAFSADIAAAQAEFESKRIRSIAEAAETINAKTGARDWRAGAWLLNNHPRYRERYREHKQVETNATVDVRHVLVQRQVRELATEDLERLALPEPTPEA